MSSGRYFDDEDDLSFRGSTRRSTPPSPIHYVEPRLPRSHYAGAPHLAPGRPAVSSRSLSRGRSNSQRAAPLSPVISNSRIYSDYSSEEDASDEEYRQMQLMHRRRPRSLSRPRSSSYMTREERELLMARRELEEMRISQDKGREGERFDEELELQRIRLELKHMQDHQSRKDSEDKTRDLLEKEREHLKHGWELERLQREKEQELQREEQQRLRQEWQLERHRDEKEQDRLKQVWDLEKRREEKEQEFQRGEQERLKQQWQLEKHRDENEQDHRKHLWELEKRSRDEKEQDRLKQLLDREKRREEEEQGRVKQMLDLAKQREEKDRERLDMEQNRLKQQWDLERRREQEKADRERKAREKEAEDAVERYKLKEAERVAREKREAEEREREYKRRIREDLSASGVNDKDIDAILKKEKLPDRKDGQGSGIAGPTYTRMSRRHLSLEALNMFRIDYEIDADPGYVLIRRWVPEEEQDRLWRYTKYIRDRRKKGGPSSDDTHRHRHRLEPQLDVGQKKERRRSRSPSLLLYLAGKSDKR